MSRRNCIRQGFAKDQINEAKIRLFIAKGKTMKAKDLYLQRLKEEGRKNHH